jgi:hypothetical protein
VSRANVFVLGIDDHNQAILESLPEADSITFHELMPRDRVLDFEDLDVPALLADARRIMRDFDGTVDAIIGYWDFPVSTLVPVLCREFGVPGPRLEGVVKCEHKYWSRLEQAQAIDEVPTFALVRLDGEPEPPADVPFPFWLKPVKSVSSQLAFRIETDDDFGRAVRTIGAGIDQISEPFDAILEWADLPPEIEEIGGRACLAEEAAIGRQFTVEGYCLDDVPSVYGVVETVLYPGTSNFQRYEYPAPIPPDVRERMTRASERVMTRIGIGSGTFNIEYFWDEGSDRIVLLEINPRLSQSHAKLTELVDGVSNFRAMVQIGLGREPAMPRGEGQFTVAGKFMPRVFSEGVVTRAPDSDAIAQVLRDLPGIVSIDLDIDEGDRLTDLPHQDPYSYALGEIVVGAADTDQLVARYDACLDALSLVIEKGPAARA